MDPASAAEFGGVDVLGWEGDGDQRRLSVARVGLRVEGGELVSLGGVPLDLDVALIVANKLALRSLEVVLE